MLSVIKIIFCFSVLCISSFVELPLLQYNFALDAFTVYDYSLQYLVCFIVSLIFMNNYAFVSVVLYILAGLIGLPVFSFGGGWQYIMEPSFGYLLAMIPLSIFAFYLRYHWPELGAKTFRDRSILPLLAIVGAHFIGLLYLLISQRFSLENFLAMSFYQLIYDLFFTHLALVFLPMYKDENEA